MPEKNKRQSINRLTLTIAAFGAGIAPLVSILSFGIVLDLAYFITVRQIVVERITVFLAACFFFLVFNRCLEKWFKGFQPRAERRRSGILIGAELMGGCLLLLNLLFLSIARLGGCSGVLPSGISRWCDNHGPLITWQLLIIGLMVLGYLLATAVAWKKRRSQVVAKATIIIALISMLLWIIPLWWLTY